MSDLCRALLWVQGAYFLATGVWPLVHLVSFMKVTGSKVDYWLVRTVGILVTVVGATMLFAAWQQRVTVELAMIAIGSAVGLLWVDVWYVARRVISPIYLADAAAEIGLLGGWACVLAEGGVR